MRSTAITQNFIISADRVVIGRVILQQSTVPSFFCKIMMFKISSIWHDNKILKGIRNDGIPDPSSPSWTTQWSEATLGRVSALSWAAAIDTNKCAPACSQSSVVFLLISLYTTTEGHLLCHLLFIIMLIIFDKVYVKKAEFILVVYHYWLWD